VNYDILRNAFFECTVDNAKSCKQGKKTTLSLHKEQELILISTSIPRLAFIATPTDVKSRAFRYAVM